MGVRVGEEPDYRFRLANERTLLAWVRTSLGLIGGGVAVDALGACRFGIDKRLSMRRRC